ncbi:MutS-related protein [Pseudoflavitalea rhizosphaerae]|uniref:MutS-related protein n=1 Tax=Pseudoflavitalea rhizosphaerae TaxID=1884793 RepID=UPI001F498272|nr:DNA mismatch repair protein [Pseudoflavitalea rhizosphaerae]
MMYLQTDDQTIEDLRLFAKRDQTGIYDIYNNTFTRGGESLLQQLFKAPLADREAITRRATVIAAFAGMKTQFPFKGGTLDSVEKYMTHAGTVGNDGSQKISLSEKEVSNGVSAVLDLMHVMRDFLIKGDVSKIPQLDEERLALLTLLESAELAPVFKERPGNKLSYAAVTAFDVLIRVRERDKIMAALQFIYQMDVFISVAGIANQRKFVFPEPNPKGNTQLKLEGVYHPELKEAVANDFGMNSQSNVVFLTGANMAGKSTFLRAISTAMYIAHMGFPVAAKKMEFPVMDGIYTTINLPDNLGIGASHFYAEVLRVKKVATELSTGKSLFIIFDELFRGTNVKDANEGTIAVTLGFAGRTNSLFIISSHIVEAGEALMEKKNIAFHFLPTRMNGHVPEYTYKLEQGISEDRHGMIIIRNEGILDTLKNGKKE